MRVICHLAATAALSLAAALAPGLSALPAAAQNATGNVIFYHPDGTGVAHWQAVRFLTVGPDGRTNWDKLPAMAIYNGHMKDGLTSTSHGGATTHAYGVRVLADSFGLDGAQPITAASGKAMSIAEEARDAGKALGLIQTGHIAEPGSAAFVASVESRRNVDEIARQVIESGAQVIMAGGERMMLPEGVDGRHGKGARKDTVDLIARAKKLGYTIVYTRDELKALDLSKIEKLLGIFASGATFNDKPEEENVAAGKDHYEASAPTIAEMGEAALAILSRDPDGFFLVAEEEGTDNMGNNNNAPGQMAALVRADQGVGVFAKFVAANPNTLLLMAADSDAGGMQTIGPRAGNAIVVPGQPLPPTDKNGAAVDGQTGTGGVPFMSAPDRAGQVWPFAISWATLTDVSGGILVRGAGKNSDQIQGVMDNTDMYRLMYLTLFGKNPS